MSRSRVRAALAVGATPEHLAAVVVEVVGGGGEHAGLAGTGRADDQDQSIVAGDRGRRLALHHVETGPLDRARRGRRVGLGCHRPGDDVFFLGQHRLGRVPGCTRFDPHRPTVRVAPRRVARRVDIDQVVDDTLGGAFDGIEPTVSR